MIGRTGESTTHGRRSIPRASSQAGFRPRGASTWGNPPPDYPWRVGFAAYPAVRENGEGKSACWWWRQESASPEFWGSASAHRHPCLPAYRGGTTPKNSADLSPIETRGELGLLLTPLYAAMAKENLKEAGKKHGKGHPKGSQNSVDLIQPIDTQKAVAKIAGVSHDTIAKVKLIQENADDSATRHQGLQIRLETR